MRTAVLFAFAVTLTAQTRSAADQHNCPAVAITGRATVWVSVPGPTTGKVRFVCAQLDPSLIVDTTTTPPTLRAQPALAPVFVDSETPGGLLNGTNAVFTLAAAPVPAASLVLYRNGIRQTPGVDYTASAATITFVAAAVPQAGDVLVADYRR